MIFKEISKNASLFYTARRFYNVFGDKLENVKVVPDVVPVIPCQELILSYENVIKIGEEISPKCVAEKPQKISLKGVNPKQLNLIMLTDADHPSASLSGGKEFLHWLVVNIPADKLDKGETVAAYIPPLPGKGTGCHRMVFTVFKQTCRIDLKNECILSNKIRRGRSNFSTKSYMCKRRLPNPLAATFFYTKYVPFVDRLIFNLEEGEIEEEFNRRANRPPFYCPPQERCKEP